MLEELLMEYCNKNAVYKDKFNQYIYVKSMLCDKLRMIPQYFIHYSRHDASHSQEIVDNIERLLGTDDLEKISASDIMIFLLASYAHDIGMALSRDEINALFEDHDVAHNMSGQEYEDIFDQVLNDTELVQDKSNKKMYEAYKKVQITIEKKFRQGHADRSGEMIEKSEKINRLLGKRCTDELAEICRLHDHKVEDIMTLPKEENGVLGDYFHPRFVAVMLRLGDLLDMDTDRFDETLLSSVSEMPALSEIHYNKHKSLKNFLVKNHKIEIISDCKQIEVYRAMREWTNWIKDACCFIKENWEEITPTMSIMPPQLKKCKIMINHNDKWNDLSDLKLHINMSKAINLLNGEGIYQDKYIFLREIIQNCIDASLVQLCRDALINCDNPDQDNLSIEDVIGQLNNGKINIDNYKIEGKFSINNGEIVLEITDSGTGISCDDIKRIAGLEDKSAEYNKEIGKYPEILRPSGTFGIGIQSVFQIADKIEFITKTENEDAKKITIESPDTTGYIYVTDYCGKIRRGTHAIITFNKKKITQDDLDCDDFEYETRDKNEMIVNRIFERYNYEKKWYEKNALLSQHEDYFDISITCDALYLDARNTIEKHSILRDGLLIENEEKIHSEKIEYGTRYLYTNFDKKNGCIFKCSFLIEDKQPELVSGDFCARVENDDEIRFKNVTVMRGLFFYHIVRSNRLFRSLTYNINILSGNARDILSLGRDEIRHSYAKRYEGLLQQEIEDLGSDFIKYCSQKGENVSEGELLFLCLFSIRYHDGIKGLSIRAENRIKQLQINCFKNLEGKICPITMDKMINEPIYFVYPCKKLDKASVSWANRLNNNVWNKIKEIIPSERIEELKLLDARFREKVCVIGFKVKKVFFTEINRERYLACETTIQYNYRSIYPVIFSDFIIYQEFLDVIFNNNRRIHVNDKKYNDLITSYHSSYYNNCIGGNYMVDVMMDEDIRSDLQKEIRERGYVDNASERYFNRIISSVQYNKNLSYIIDSHKKSRKLSSNEQNAIIDLYKEFYLYLLCLLKEMDLSFALKTNINKLCDDNLAKWTESHILMPHYDSYLFV